MANTTTQGLRQTVARTATGTTVDYNGDFLALFTLRGIGLTGGFNGRLLNYINTKLVSAYTNLPEAMQAFKVANQAGATNFSAMSIFTS
jgi:hypothetical protein